MSGIIFLSVWIILFLGNLWLWLQRKINDDINDLIWNIPLGSEINKNDQPHLEWVQNRVNILMKYTPKPMKKTRKRLEDLDKIITTRLKLY